MSVVKDWDEPTPPIWTAEVDEGAYRVIVDRLHDRTGQLKIYRRDEITPFFEQAVQLAFGAVFGPDVADVAYWQQAALERIDSDIAARS